MSVSSLGFYLGGLSGKRTLPADSSVQRTLQHGSPAPARTLGLRIHFGGQQGLTPGAFKVLQAWALKQRAAMPLLQQALYPLRGNRAGIEQMTELTGQLEADPRFQDFPLTREGEMKLIAPLLLYAQLQFDPSQNARLQAAFMGNRIDNLDTKSYLLHQVYGSPDPMIRQYMFHAGTLEDKKLDKNDLLELVHDFHPVPRQKLAEFLPQFPKTRRRREVHRQLLNDRMPAVRGAAAAVAPQIIKGAKGLEILCRALQGSDETERAYAIPGLRHVTDRLIVEHYVRRFLQEEPESAVHFTEMREQMNPALWQRVVDTLAESEISAHRFKAVFLTEDESVREHLLMALTETNTDYSVPLYQLYKLPEKCVPYYFEKLAADKKPSRRIAALYLLRSPAMEATNVWQLKERVLKQLLQDPDDEVRAEAIFNIGDDMPDAEDFLLDALSPDANSKVRQRCIWKLDKITDPAQRLSLFQRLIEDPDPKVRYTAANRVTALSPPVIRDAYAQYLLAHSDAELRAGAVANYEWPKDQYDANMVKATSLLKDPSPQVRTYMAYTLGDLLGEGMKRFFESPYPRLLQEALRQLDPETTLSWKDMMGACAVLLQSGADGTRLRDILKGYRDVSEHAQKHREQFVQEGQQALTEPLMAAWLKRTAPHLLTAIALTGSEAVKAKFDEKAAKFQHYLLMANALAVQPEIGPLLYQTLHNRVGAYPTEQVNRMLEMFYGLMLLGKEKDVITVLRDVQRTRTIDIPTLQNLFVENLGRVAGISDKILAREDVRKNLAAWNDPYTYTIGSALNVLPEDLAGILMEIVKADAVGRFSKFLTDPSQPWGKANRQTAQAFREHGLNYKTWVSYNQPMTVRLGDKELEIELWKRKPSEDLFIGSHVKTCMALDARSEEMVDALLNTFAQYAIVRDKKSGERLGYIRLFWTVSDGNLQDKKPILMVDNVAYAFETSDPHAKNLLPVAKAYAETLGRAVTGGETPTVAFSKYIHLIPQKHIEDRPIRVIGQARDNKYYLFAVNQYMSSDITKGLTAHVISSRNIPSPSLDVASGSAN